MINTVKGSRSPRWAFNATMSIPCRDGIPYLFRRRLVQTPRFGIYLHDIFEPDADRDPHDHPWTFISIVLRGSYTERLHLYPHVYFAANYRDQTWKRWSVHKMTRETAHRITYAEPGLKTLIFTGPRKRNWGFFTDLGYVTWQAYEKCQQGREPKPEPKTFCPVCGKYHW